MTRGSPVKFTSRDPTAAGTELLRWGNEGEEAWGDGTWKRLYKFASRV